MIKDIEIENFRCFEFTKIEGFERVNLIGGKNNSGKTALLEAITINQSPEPDTILLLTKIRDNTLYYSQSYPEKIWNSLFFKNQTSNKAVIIINGNSENLQKLTLSVSLFLQSSDTIKVLNESFTSNDFFEDPDYIYKLSVELTSNKFKQYKLFMKSTNEGIKLGGCNIQILGYDRYKIPVNNETRFRQFINKYRFNFTAQYIAASLKLTQKEVIKEYSNAELENRGHYLLEILKKIDPRIEDIKIFSIRDPILYLKRENENFLPISMFGDAINRVTEIIVRVLNNQSSIVLIDEIENGIHYTNHRDFWKALFELSKELDVQIFATTHSLEMIQAFRDIGLNYYADSGAYFEMATNPRNNKIVGIKHELEMLDYALKRSEGVRGE
ncbi:MAG: ATP/GTP-binding protein [Crocosphaera sp.]